MSGTALGRGGGLHKASGRLTLRDVAVVGNAALGTGHGGGVFVTDSTTVVEMTNVTIGGNFANQQGGGLYSNNAIAGTLAHVTVAGNEATGGGGGFAGDLSSFRLRSSIVAGNLGGASPNCTAGFAPASDGGNAGDPACGLTLASDAQTLDPLLDPLSLSSPVPVMVPRAGSPAIDRAVGLCPATDARGLARPQGAGCDAGAAELPVPPPTPAPPQPPPAPPAAAPLPPVPRTLPRIGGSARVGRTLRCRAARFQGATRTTTAWLRNGRAIRRATRSRYRLTAPDRGRVVTCRTTGIGPGGTTAVVAPGVLVRR